MSWKTGVESDWEGQWNHYAFTVDSAVENKVKIFHNGELVEEGGASLGVCGIQSFHVGCGVFVVGGTTYYPYAGRLDDFRVYNYALSPDEVLYIANDGRMAISLATNLYDDDVIDSKDFAIFALQWREKCQ
ncbi:MAG: LamG-like jellyroll fold domain-containing protein [Planctomycetota bacterium]